MRSRTLRSSKASGDLRGVAADRPISLTTGIADGATAQDGSRSPGAPTGRRARGARRRHLLSHPALAVGLSVALGAAVAASVALSGDSATPRTSATAAKTARRDASLAATFLPLVAVARRPSVELYRSPNVTARHEIVPSVNDLGVGAVFLVKRREGTWFDVYVPRRPDGSTAWVTAGEVALRRDPYEVVADLAHHTVVVRDGSRVIVRARAATGKPSTPTPVGTFFVTELLRQPDPHGAYGPYAYGLSAFSHVLHHFGGGPGQIGFHGTDEPQVIGTSASHGCIRVANGVIRRLAFLLPLGTPVVVES